VTVNALTADPVVDAGEAGGAVANPIVDVGKVTQSVVMTGPLIDAISDNVPKGLASGRASGRKKLCSSTRICCTSLVTWPRASGLAFLETV